MVFVTCRPSLNPNAVLDDIGTSESMIEEESMVQNGKLLVPIGKGRFQVPASNKLVTFRGPRNEDRSPETWSCVHHSR